MKEKATFAAGCFWGVEDAFMKCDGVLSTRVGYTGGKTDNPKYRDVCSGTTGHKEAVEITYDTDKTSYENLLRRFWSIHDPTTRDRQGADSGEQYRSVIYYHNEDQQKIAEKSKQELMDSKTHKNPIITDIEPAQTFYEAEEYHQKYLQKQGGTCQS